MIKKQLKLWLLVFTMVTIFSTMHVEAKIEKITVCHNNNTYYVTYDTKENTNVTSKAIKELVGSPQFPLGYLPNPNGAADVTYKYQALLSGTKCYMSGNTVKQCARENLVNTYMKSGGTKTKTNVVIYSPNDDKTYDIKIEDKYHGKAKMRYVHGNMTPNVDPKDVTNAGKKNSDEYAQIKFGDEYPDSEFLSSTYDASAKKWYFNLYNVPGENVSAIIMEFYRTSTDVCNNTFLGQVIFFPPNINTFMVKNPATQKGTDLYDKCEAFKKDKLGVTGKDADTLNKYKKMFVPYCYQTEVLFPDLKTLSTDIDNGIQAVKNFYSIYKPNAGKEDTTCDNEISMSKSVYAASGEYWAVSCFETYTAAGDKPKLVKAGAGFEYEANYTLTKQCSMVQIKKPSKKAQCVETTSCNCHWVGVAGTVFDEDQGGPSAEYDNCIIQCDGGKYTKGCISSCYNDVYGKKRNISFMDKLIDYTKENTTSNDNIKRTAVDCSGGGRIPGSYDIPSDQLKPIGKTITRWGKEANVFELNGATCAQSVWCDAHEFKCVWHVEVGPDDCSWCPDSEYYQDLAASNDELNRFKDAADRELNSDTVGKYTYEIYDSYHKKYFRVNNRDNPNVKVTFSSSKSGDSASTELGSSGGPTVSYYKSRTVTTTINVKLPVSYVDKLTSMPTYKSAENSEAAFTFENTKESANDLIKTRVQAFNASQYYHQVVNGVPERKYYTDKYSPNTNVTFEGNKPKLVRPETDTKDWNIRVLSSDVGDLDEKFSSTIDCYYGVYNKFICSPPCDEDITGSGGLQFIFRPIELTDMFPNGRKPRFNWSCKATLKDWYKQNIYKTLVAPVALTKRIEKLGNDVYDPSKGEMDYEFILTGKNIQNIKDYNKSIRNDNKDYNKDGSSNYLDYDMVCQKNTSNGMDVCISKFLDNPDYVIYSGEHNAESRKKIVGCNNATENGTKCDLTLSKEKTSADICTNSYGTDNNDSECENLVEVSE